MKHYLWSLRCYFRQVSGELVIGSLCGILTNTMAVVPAIMLGRAIDTALAFEKGLTSAHDVTRAALAFLGGTLATQIPRMGKRWFLITANGRIRANIRSDAMRGVLGWPMERFHKTSTGELMARIMGDVDVLGTGIRELTVETWDTLLLSISCIVTLCLYDSQLSALALLPTPIAMLLARATGQWVRGRTTSAREVNSALTALLQEQLAGLRVLKLFGRTEAGADRVANQSQRLVAANLAVVRLREGLKPVYATLMISGIVIVMGIGGQSVITGTMTVGAFVTYLEVFLRFTARGHRIPQMINAIQSGGAAYARIAPLLTPPAPATHEPRWASFIPGRVHGMDDPVAIQSPVAKGPIDIAVKDLTFRYPDATQPALVNLSLHIQAGALVAITGPVGCGKSALLRVILGLYPVERGDIQLDGQALSAISEDERAARIGYLPQDPHLFSESVRANIAFGTGLSIADPRIDAALKTAMLQTDLATFPAGIETQIGELGTRVSGGQRQRIALARSLAATPSSPGLLLLDDPFSAVDLDTEAELIAALRSTYGPTAPAQQRATILLSSHRLAAFPQADQIVVLDHGSIVESGTHSELLAKSGLYSRIFHAQALVSKTETGTQSRNSPATPREP